MASRIKFDEITNQAGTGAPAFPYGISQAGLTKSVVVVHTGNGFGSTGTKIRRFSTIHTNTGTAITYADSATAGASFTINETGFYAITYGDEHSSTTQIGLSVNTPDLTANINLVSFANGFIYRHINVSGQPAITSVVLPLTAGDIVRPHGDGTATSTSKDVNFRITKILG